MAESHRQAVTAQVVSRLACEMDIGMQHFPGLAGGSRISLGSVSLSIGMVAGKDASADQFGLDAELASQLIQIVR